MTILAMGSLPPVLSLFENASLDDWRAEGERFGRWYGKRAAELLADAVSKQATDDILFHHINDDMVQNVAAVILAGASAEASDAFSDGQRVGFKQQLEIEKLKAKRGAL